jgi:hypothetical protein
VSCGLARHLEFSGLAARTQRLRAISTYQAGKLVILRPDENSINTHFRTFNRPMGMAADRLRLMLGALMEIVEFRNMPDVAKRLHDPPVHDTV